MNSMNNPQPDIQSQSIWDIAQRIQKANNINVFRKIVKSQYPKVAFALSRFQEYLKSAVPDISSENKIFSYIEDIFYIMPKEQKIYCFYDKINKVFTPRLLKDYISKNIQCDMELDENVLYTLVADLLTKIARVQPCGYLFNRYLHNVYCLRRIIDTPFQYPYNHFIMVDDIICFMDNRYYYTINNAPYFPSVRVGLTGYTNLIPLINDGFNYVTSQILCYPNMPQKLKKTYISALKKCTPKKYPNSNPIANMSFYKSSDYLFDSAGKSIKYKNEQLIAQPHNNSDYLYNFLPQSFIYEEYSFSEQTADLLAKITNNSRKSFNSLAKLTAAAYLNGSPLKSATVIIANGNSYNDIEKFFVRLFNGHICCLSNYHYNTVESNYNVYLNSKFQHCKAYIIKGETSPANYKGIRQLVKSTYFEVKDEAAGKIRFKNTIPLIVLTKSEEYAKQFNIQVKSDIIRIDSDSLPTDKIYDYEFAMLRQALSLYGFRLFSAPPSAKKSDVRLERGRSDEAIVNSFINQFCKAEPEGFASKSELRDAFAEYTAIYYPYFKSAPIAVCNRLRDMGYDGKHKKRVDGCDNPVAIIRGIEFDRVKFTKRTKFRIEPEEKSGNENTEQAQFDILSELNSAKIDVLIEPTVKTFYV